jgi:carboxylesterase type B
MATTLKSSIGEFRGVKRDRVVQYLGIKYADLKDQLAVPELVKSYGGEVVDATRFG